MTWDRIISLAIVIVYATVAWAFGPRDPRESTIKALGIYFCVMVIPLGLIWFGDELGDYVGTSGRGSITRRTPGFLVKGFGWVVLVVLLGLGAYGMATGN